MTAYATPADLYTLGIAEAALIGVSLDTINSTLASNGRRIDSYLRAGGYGVPFSSPYPLELVRCNAVLSAYDLMVTRGYNPESADQTLKERAEFELRWLKDIAAGKVKLDSTKDATPSEFETAPLLASDDQVDFT